MCHFLKLLLVILIIGNSKVAWSIDQICDPWFKESGVKPGPDCFLDCATLPVGMETFDCHNDCPGYCNQPVTADFIFKLTDLYPGLTSAERALAAQYSGNALLGYKDALAVESLCASKFGKSRTNDESDACRHFMWAGIMSDHIGRENAANFLNAHEDYPDNPPDEKKMDLLNNATGMQEAESLKKSKSFTRDALEKRFDEDLAKGQLSVLKPQLKRKIEK
jgi:hypothetical protein